VYLLISGGENSSRRYIYIYIYLKNACHIITIFQKWDEKQHQNDDFGMEL
jgi:hypothetical protein